MLKTHRYYDLARWEQSLCHGYWNRSRILRPQSLVTSVYLLIRRQQGWYLPKPQDLCIRPIFYSRWYVVLCNHIMIRTDITIRSTHRFKGPCLCRRGRWSLGLQHLRQAYRKDLHWNHSSQLPICRKGTYDHYRPDQTILRHRRCLWCTYSVVSEQVWTNRETIVNGI